MIVLGCRTGRQAVQPYSRTIMAAMMAVLLADNETNALLALRVVGDLHRSKRSRKPDSAEDPTKLDDFVAPYLEFVQKARAQPRALYALQPPPAARRGSFLAPASHLRHLVWELDYAESVAVWITRSERLSGHCLAGLLAA